MRSWSTRLMSMAAIALTLAGCELRNEQGEEVPDEVPETQAPQPSATATPSASIIREDIAPAEEIALPTEPVELTIPFPDGSDLNERAERLLAGLLTSDAIDEDWPVIVGGHTDSSGNDQANLRASRARAEAVAAWLVERGIEDSRIRVIAFGEQNPIAPNALPDGTPNELGRRTNRRVEIRIGPPASAAAEEQAVDEDA